MKIAVECDWEDAGAVQLVDDGLRMPALPDEPGVYQWVFRHDGRERRYVGEAANLRQRFESYRQPGSDASTNRRMNDRARRVLEADGDVRLLTAAGVQLLRDGQAQVADLASKHVRCLLENATLVDVLATMGELVNDRGYGVLRDDPVLG